MKIRTKTRCETEAQGNSQMVYLVADYINAINSPI